MKFPISFIYPALDLIKDKNLRKISIPYPVWFETEKIGMMVLS